MSRLRVPLVLLVGLILIYDCYAMTVRETLPAMTLVQSGVASWYGSEEQGKPTANGETYDRRELTAASRRLPFNTVVRVTNQDNGRSVQVRINDRGPFVNGRVLDLSEASADILGMKQSGTAPVKIQVVAPGSAEAAISP